MKKEALLLAVALVLLLTAEASANTAPLIGESDAEILVCEGSAISYGINITDIDSSVLTVWISPANPFYAKIAPSDSQLFKLEIFSDNLTKSQANKDYAETIYVSDGQLTDARKIKLIVLETNNPPVMNPLGVETVLLEQQSSFTKKVFVDDVESGDQDAGRIAFSARDASGYWDIEVNAIGVVNLSRSSIELGLHQIEVCATDSAVKNIDQKIGFCGKGDLRKTICDTFQLALVETNSPPTILLYNSTNQSNSILDTEAVTFELYKFDPEGIIPDTYWYVDGVLKQFSSGNPSDQFTYSFGCDISGRHAIRAEITDGSLNDSAQWIFNVQKTECLNGAIGEKIGNKRCEEKWGCENWNLCQNAAQSKKTGVLSGNDYNTINSECLSKNWGENACGFQIRTCTDTNECNTASEKPPEISACYFSLNPSCSDNIKNCHNGDCELAVDCGGPCDACATCSDEIKNQEEEGIDCGGPCFTECPIKTLSAGERTFKQSLLISLLLLILFAAVQTFRVIKTKNELKIIPSKRVSLFNKPAQNLAPAKALVILLVFLFLLPYVKAENCFPQYQCSTWSSCEDGLQTRTCIDTACGNRDIIERSFCEKEGCRPKIECGSWGSCIYTEKSDDLIEGKVSFGGYRTRVCRDTNGCVEDFIQEGSCVESYNLEFSPITECNEDFLAVIDPASERKIAKINLASWKFNKLDLTFVQGDLQYCPSCYNTVQDQGETGVDCGGPCKPCRPERKFLLTASIVLLWLFSAMFIFFSAREIIIMRKLKNVGVEI